MESKTSNVLPRIQEAISEVNVPECQKCHLKLGSQDSTRHTRRAEGASHGQDGAAPGSEQSSPPGSEGSRRPGDRKHLPAGPLGQAPARVPAAQAQGTRNTGSESPRCWAPRPYKRLNQDCAGHDPISGASSYRAELPTMGQATNSASPEALVLGGHFQETSWGAWGCAGH